MKIIILLFCIIYIGCTSCPDCNLSRPACPTCPDCRTLVERDTLASFSAGFFDSTSKKIYKFIPFPKENSPYLTEALKSNEVLKAITDWTSFVQDSLPTIHFLLKKRRLSLILYHCIHPDEPFNIRDPILMYREKYVEFLIRNKLGKDVDFGSGFYARTSFGLSTGIQIFLADENHKMYPNIYSETPF